jgi:hypothetical protein
MEPGVGSINLITQWAAQPTAGVDRLTQRLINPPERRAQAGLDH